MGPSPSETTKTDPGKMRREITIHNHIGGYTDDAGFRRNHWPDSLGIGGRHHSEYPHMGIQHRIYPLG